MGLIGLTRASSFVCKKLKKTQRNIKNMQRQQLYAYLIGKQFFL